MSFRQYGGINYAARNNIVKNNFTNANNLNIMTKVGQPESLIDVQSTLDVYAINLTSPTITLNDNGVVPKSYVDLIAIGLRPVAACQCGTDEPLEGDPSDPTTIYDTPLIIDGQTVGDGERVLIKDQPPTVDPYAGSVQNGIYVFITPFGTSTGTFARADDYLSGSTAYGAYTLVQNGTKNGNKQFIQLTQGDVGSVPLLFTPFTSSFTVGQGLLKYSTGSSTIVEVNSDLSTDSFITSLAVSGLTKSDQLLVNGTATISTASCSSLTVSGTTSLANTSISGTLTVAGLSISGATVGTLTVNGATTLANTTVNGTFNVPSATTTLGGPVNSTANIKALSFTGNGSTLNVSKYYSLDQSDQEYIVPNFEVKNYHFALNYQNPCRLNLTNIVVDPSIYPDNTRYFSITKKGAVSGDFLVTIYAPSGYLFWTPTTDGGSTATMPIGTFSYYFVVTIESGNKKFILISKA